MSESTQKSFRDKWERNRSLAFAETLDPESNIQEWILRRNGFADRAAFASFLGNRRRILDAGCGNGRVSALIASLTAPDTEIVAMDLVSHEVAAENLADIPAAEVVQGDLLGDLRGLGRFDYIYCQEVLHHTDDPARAFANLASLLLPGGELAIYVYRRKAPIREYTDDYLRARITDLPYDDAMMVCRSVADLGRVLSEIRDEVTVPAIDALGIQAGRYSVQRLVYHFFMKCFWSPRLSPEENAVINYDWYHPQVATRHTLEEIQGWFAGADLAIVHEYEDHYGITVRGVRR